MSFGNGDTHGHKDRMLGLLVQEGFANKDGKRLQNERFLFHCGDVIHSGRGQSAADDLETVKLAEQLYNKICWGNHDYACVDGSAKFTGYEEPLPETKTLLNKMEREGKLVFAIAVDGFLITHAGIHPEFEKMLPSDPVAAAEAINYSIDRNDALFTSPGPIRGGWSNSYPGGILWRDYSEDISDKWPQIFGHSSNSQVRTDRVMHDKNDNPLPEDKHFSHYCIDVGNADNGELAGIYTDTKQIRYLEY